MLLLQQVTGKTVQYYKKSLQLIGAKVLLRCALFNNILAEAKHFRLVTQKQDSNIISILDFVKNTKYNYQRLLKKLKRNPSYVFSATNTETCR